MAKNLWDKEYNRVYRELVRDYLDDGYDIAEAKFNASKDAKEIMKHVVPQVRNNLNQLLNSISYDPVPSNFVYDPTAVA